MYVKNQTIIGLDNIRSRGKRFLKISRTNNEMSVAQKQEL